MANLLPTSGNLYHHALEMLLKSGLLREYSHGDIKKKFGHNLPKIWTAFKVQFGTAQLDRFDTTISALHKFEDIRYPDRILNEGARMVVEWRSSTSENSRPSVPPVYRLVVNELDCLIADIFDICSLNLFFFTSHMIGTPHVQQILMDNNPIAERLLPPSDR